MRRIMLADVAATAQLLARWPAAERPAQLDRLLSQAQAADRFSRRLGRPHAQWGNGSLLARALAEPSPTPNDHDYWASFSLVAAALAARKSATGPKSLGLSDDRSI